MKQLHIIFIFLFSIVGSLSSLLALVLWFYHDSPTYKIDQFLWAAFWTALFFTCFGSITYSIQIVSKTKDYKKAVLLSLETCILFAIFYAIVILIETFCQGILS